MDYPQLLISDKKGNIVSAPEFHACGQKAGIFYPLKIRDLIRLPYGSQLMMMPQRSPVGIDLQSSNFVNLDVNPYNQKEKCFAVSAFIAPGYTAKYNAAYKEQSSKVGMLPLFAYTAVCIYKDEFYVPAMKVDRELRQDCRYMDMNIVKRNTKEFKKYFKGNRLYDHLVGCALCNECPAAKNFFLNRYEGPLPTSSTCNSRCLGCLSYQPEKKCPVTQPRIKFMPTPNEIAEIALFHLNNVKDPVVSFGQGCEGEPLLAFKSINDAIRLIRTDTKKGIINLNTNASKPDLISKLIDSGLDSIRVSMNSMQKKYYDRYYRPVNYGFKDVLESIVIAKKKKKFVSVNYLVIPGFTDSLPEYNAFIKFINKYKPDMIQWRNLNFDPFEYFKQLDFYPEVKFLIGIENVIKNAKKVMPTLMHGYFNPSINRIKRKKGKLEI